MSIKIPRWGLKGLNCTFIIIENLNGEYKILQNLKEEFMHLNDIGKYWDKRAEGYSLAINEEFENEVRDIWIEKFEKYRPVEGKMKCLEIGCGPGFLSTLLAINGNDVTSIDYSDEMLEKAKENSEKNGVKLNLLKMDAQNLDFEDNTFDLVVNRNVTWNLEEPKKAYREWLRVLKPGGRIIINDGNHYFSYYDEKYAKFKELREAKHKNEPHKFMMGVDPTYINELARELPLSKVERPVWDADFFINEGVSSISIDPVKATLQDENGDDVSVIAHFDICVTKPAK